MTRRCLFFACAILLSTRCGDAIDTIITLPKEIRAVGKPIPREGFGIVSADAELSLI